MTSSSSHTYKNVCLGLSLLVLLCIAVGVTGSLHGLAPPNSSPVHSTVAPTSVTEYFLTSKIAFAVLILLSSMLGVLAPSLLLILWGRDRVRKARRASSPLDSDTTTMMGSSGGEATAGSSGSSDSPLAGVGSLLSLSNCFSAGLLVGMGALHFIPEGFEGAAEILPSKWVGTHEHHHEGDEGQHTHHFHSPGWMAYIGGTAESATLFFLLIGIGVPVLIDRAVNWLTAAPACGDHSHGGTFLDALDKKEGGGGKPDDVAHHKNNNTHGTTTADASSNKPRSAATTLILLAALLSFHGTTEGVVIGSTLETASITTLGTFIITNPLLSLMLPMTLHKFFDALVLGIPVAEETRRRLEEAMRDGSSHVSMWGTCISILRKKTVLISTISTPVVLLGTTIMTYSVAVGKEGGGNHHTHPPTPPGATAADEGGSNNLQVLSFASKAVGAGTFLYIGIAEIIVTEMKGVFAQLRGSGVGVVQGVLRHGGSILPSIAPKLASIGAGMLVVVVMGWVFPHQHSS